MSAPHRKQVTSEVFRRIADAIDAIANDDSAKRTKREIENRSGLSHDAVHRAFMQDMEGKTEWQINVRFAALREGRDTRVSPRRGRQVDAEQAVVKVKEELAAEKRQTDRFMMALFALHLESTEEHGGQTGGVIPIGRNRNTGRRGQQPN